MTEQLRDETKPVPLMLRLPPELHAIVKEIAARNRRSLNSQCIILLENAVVAETGQPVDRMGNPPHGEKPPRPAPAVPLSGE